MSKVDSGKITKERVLATALALVDTNGLDALSMNKLGAELGVKGMTLYYYVDNKDDVLDGLVDLLWTEIDLAPLSRGDWHKASTTLAQAVRDLVLRHPHSAPLIMTRPVASVPALQLYATYLAVLQDDGFTRKRALEMLRILLAYGFGYGAAELTWTTLAGKATTRRQPPRTPDEIFAGVPDHLVAVAVDVCRGANQPAHFHLGLDAMLRGMETDKTE